MNTSSDEKKTESLASDAHEKLRTDGRREKETATMANNSGKRRGGGFKRLIEEEYKKKREKRICFRSDEKFTPGHRCKNKQLNVLILSEEAKSKLEALEDELPLEIGKKKKRWWRYH